MNWREEKQRAENSLTEINKNLNIKSQYRNTYTYEIKTSGKQRLWKTIYLANQNISEGFRTWREVAIFLSGFRKALMI